MATEKEVKVWEAKQRKIIEILEEQGLDPKLQMLKAKIMGVSYAAFLNREGEELVKYIGQYDFQEYDDLALESHVESLKEEERAVITVKYGLDSDGVRITSKKTAEILEISSHDVPNIEKRAIVLLKEAYTEYTANRRNADAGAHLER